MAGNPKVSVCISSYNHERYLRHALDSVLAQTYTDFEVIVVDDGSQDDSLALLELYAAQHPAIKVFTHPQHANKGISITTNLAIEHARGEYIAFLGSDDAWCADKLERQLPVLESDAKVGLIYSLTYLMDSEGRQAPERHGSDCAASPGAMALMIRRNRIHGLTTIVRRCCLDSVGLFDESLVYNDWELWLRIMAHWKVAFVAAPLAVYRVHGSNTSVGIEPAVHLRHCLAATLALRRKAAMIKGLLDEPRMQALVDLQAAYTHFFLHQGTQAAQTLSRAFDTDATLRTDARGLARWLDAQIHDGIDVLPPELTGHDFSEWVLSKLPAIVGTATAKRMARYFSALSSARAAGTCYAADAPRATRLALKSFLTDPRQIAKRDLLVIPLKTIVGRRMVKRIGKLKKKLHSDRTELGS